MPKKVVYLVHGFNVRDKGAGTVDRLGRFFERAGYKVKQFDYLWAGLLRVRLCNKGLAYAFSKLVEPGSIAVGHSNGCAIIHEAAQSGAYFQQVVYINPALDKSASLGPRVRCAHVWHSPSDKPVRLAAYLPKHSWGKMGAVGYKGDDSRYLNYNKEDDYDLSSCEHSDVFEMLKLNYFGPKIVQAVESKRKLLES